MALEVITNSDQPKFPKIIQAMQENYREGMLIGILNKASTSMYSNHSHSMSK
jgi:hypothetical protein